jgi:hypothetical protein
MDGSGTHGRGPLRRFGNTVPGPQAPELTISPDARRCSELEFAAVRRAIWRQNGRWCGWAMDRAKAVAGRVRAALAKDGI